MAVWRPATRARTGRTTCLRPRGRCTRAGRGSGMPRRASGIRAWWSPCRPRGSRQSASAPRPAWGMGRHRLIGPRSAAAARHRPRAREAARPRRRVSPRRPRAASVSAVGGRLQTLARPARAQSAGSAGARRHTSGPPDGCDSIRTGRSSHDARRLVGAAQRCPTTSSVVSRKSAPPGAQQRVLRTRKPRRSGAFCNAPKRTRTSTRLSRTRPSTW